MFGSKFWEEIFGEQILLNEKKIGGRGGGMGNNFFLKQIFLRGNFGGTKFWRRDSCEEEIPPAKIFWRNFCK